MAADADPEQFEILLDSIERHVDREEFERAVKLCEKAVALRPDLAVGRRYRIFSLINLSKWSEALQECEKVSAADGPDVAFEKVYCLYRLNRFQEALDILPAAALDNDPRWQRLEAQVRYRMGDYATCANTYAELFEENREDVGLLVNAVASDVSGGEARKAAALLEQHEELLEGSYELCFNLGCALLDEGKLDDAETRLAEAKRMCIKELVEDGELPADDVVAQESHAEIIAIEVQKAVVLQRRGLTSEAASVYDTVLRKALVRASKPDLGVLAVATNNVVTMDQTKMSLLDSISSRYSFISKEALDQKLTRKQCMDIAVNKVMLLLEQGDTRKARRELEVMGKAFPGNPRVAILQAAVESKHQPKKAVEVLQAAASEDPECAEVKLCLAEVYNSLLSKPAMAIEVLASLGPRCRAGPKVLEAITTLYKKRKEPEKALASGREAVEYWKVQEGSDMDEAAFDAVLRIVMRLAEELGDQDLKAEANQLVLECVDGNDGEALCGLVAALAGTDLERAERYTDRMTIADYDFLDAEELELGQPPMPKGIDPDEEGDSDEEALGRKRKKKKVKNKLKEPTQEAITDQERAGMSKAEQARQAKIRFTTQGGLPVDDTAFRKTGPTTSHIEVSAETTRRNAKKKQSKK